jgi:hypothetical protein
MSERDSAWQTAQDAADALAPEVELVADLDMAGFGGSLIAVLNRAMERPAQLAGASLQLCTNLARIAPFAVARAAGQALRGSRLGREPGVRRAAPGIPGGPAVLRGPARGGPR